MAGDSFLTDKQRSTRLIAVSVGVAAALGFVFVSTKGVSAPLWAAACGAAGAIVGFLFGIPRTLQSEQPANAARRTEGDTRGNYAQLVNTNLEQISDWLTKILVGLGLTQLGQVPARLQATAGYIASGMPGGAAEAPFAAAMIVYFSLVGFLGGYLLTRLVLAPAFRAADVEHVERRIELIEEKVTETAGRVSRAAVEVKLHSDLNRSLVSSLQDLARSEVPASTLEENIRELEPLRQEYPTHRTLHIVLGRLHDALRQYDKSIEILSDFLAEKARQGQTSDKDVADVLYNRACSYSLKSTTVKGTEAEKYRKLALEDLRQSIEMSPPNAVDAKNDHDFDSIQELDEFKSLIAK